MKKLILICGTTIVSFMSASAQTWSLDRAHSKLGFSITHMKISDVEGSFGNFDVKVTAAKADFTDAQIELTADINTVDTDNEGRDKHLKNEDYFDAAKYPTMVFKSTGIKKTKGNNYVVSGNLTMHGITKPVTLNAVLKGVGENPMSKKTVAGFKISGVIDRTAFKVGEASPMLGSEVTLSSNLELVKG